MNNLFVTNRDADIFEEYVDLIDQDEIILEDNEYLRFCYDLEYDGYEE